MIKIRLSIIFFITIILISKSSLCQFNYYVSLDSSVTYQALTGATSLNNGQKWEMQYRIPVGFPFTFNGKTVDTLLFEANGFLTLDPKMNYALMTFNNFYCKHDSANQYSCLNYAQSGSPGSRILKLECKNVGQTDRDKEALSYQLWIRESGSIEIFIGPNTYAPLPGDTVADTMQVVHMGLINRNMDTAEKGLFISGTPKSPSPAPLNESYTEIAWLRTVPKQGYRYIFTPTN